MWALQHALFTHHTNLLITISFSAEEIRGELGMSRAAHLRLLLLIFLWGFYRIIPFQWISKISWTTLRTLIDHKKTLNHLIQGFLVMAQPAEFFLFQNIYGVGNLFLIPLNWFLYLIYSFLEPILQFF